MKQLHDQDKSPLNIKYWHLKLNLWCQTNEIKYLRRSPFQNVINGCPSPPLLGRRFLDLEGVLLIETVKNSVWVIFVFNTMYNVWVDSGESSLNISQPPNRNLFDVLQAKRIESFYAHHNILTQGILHGGIVERFVTNWNVESVHLKQLKWFPIHDEVNRTDQIFSEILLCLIYGHLGGH